MGHIINATAQIRLGYRKNGFILDRRIELYVKYLHEDFVILDL